MAQRPFQFKLKTVFIATTVAAAVCWVFVRAARIAGYGEALGVAWSATMFLVAIWWFIAWYEQ